MTDIEKRYLSVVGNLPDGWSFKRNDYLYEERKEFCNESESTENLLSVSEYYGVAKRAEKVEDGDIVSRAETLEGYRKCFKDDFVMNYMLAWKGAQATSKLDGVVSPSYAVFKPRGGMLPRFANYLFRTKLYCGLFEINSTGIIKSRLRLYPKAFLKINAIVPPLSEQQSIVSYLDKKCDTIDKAINKRKQLIEKLEEYRKSIIFKAVTKGLNPNVEMKESNSWEGETPCSWKKNKIKYVALLINERSASNEGYVGLENIEGWSGKLMEASQEPTGECVSFKRNDVMFGKLRPYLGKSFVAKKDGCGSTELLVLRPVRIEPYYLGYMFRSEPMVDRIDVSTYGTKMPRASGRFIGEMIISIPDSYEQQSIVSYLDKKCAAIEEAILKNKDIITKLEEYRKSIIYNAVTGKIDCREAM